MLEDIQPARRGGRLSGRRSKGVTDNGAEAQRPDPVLVASGLWRRYGDGAAAVEALRGVDISLYPGRITALMGPSGSGKSTLLHLLAGLDTPTEGEIRLGGDLLSALSEQDRASWRAQHAGFVLQANNLIPSLTVEENVAAPMLIAGQSRKSSLQRAREMLAEVGLDHRAGAWPAEVSGGEAQRAAVARACAGSPKVVFADEPTGALDSAASTVVMELVARMSRAVGAATLLVTHDPEAAATGDEVLHLRDGKLAEQAS